MIEEEQEQAGLAWQIGVWNEISEIYLSEIDRRFTPVTEATTKRAELAAGESVLGFSACNLLDHYSLLGDRRPVVGLAAAHSGDLVVVAVRIRGRLYRALVGIRAG